MNVIQQSNLDIINNIGGILYKIKSRKYRLNKYCIELEVEEGTLIYNTLTGAIVMLRPFEYTNIYTEDPCDYVEFLVKNYFLVPQEFDEESLILVYRNKKQIPITETYLDHPTHFTILTTTTCNARCFYCYEMKSKHKTPMSIDTAEKVAKYILDAAPPEGIIELGWFGGEPLFNLDVIDIITSRVLSAGRDVQGSIISNGYLFDKKTTKKARNEWKINSAQITLDGTAEVYNKTKRYIYKDNPNPFQTVIDNIHNLLDNDIAVSVRMNCDKHNEENLLELVKYLGEEFKDSKLFSMYVWAIFEEGFTRTPELRKELYDSLTRIDSEIMKFSKNLAQGAEGGIRGLHCMVDSNNGITISPNGDIGVCEHYIDSDFISHIDNPLKKNWNIIKSWREYVEPLEICKDCLILPTCLKMHKCPDETRCDIYERDYKLWHIKLDMILRWNNYKSYPKCDGNSCNCTNKCGEIGEHSVWQQVMSDGTIKTVLK